MTLYSLREIFELRNVQFCRPRVAFGRYFSHQSLPGFSDGTGAVWPVELAPDSASVDLIEGCVYRLRVGAPSRSGRTPSSHLSEVHQGSAQELMLVEVLELVAGAQLTHWTLMEIPDPGCFGLFPKQQSSIVTTRYFRTQTSIRLARLRARAAAIERTRALFLAHGYLELDPPTLVPSGGLERYLNSFVTHYVDHRGQQWPLQLPTSPELALKKIMCEGSERIFSLDHAYRNNGELSAHHDPEFLMLEWYRQSEDFDGLMTETQRVVEAVAQSLGSLGSLPQEPWPRFSVENLFKDLVQLELKALADTDTFRQKAALRCLSIVATDTWDDVFCKIFMEFVEPFLKTQKACFVTHYPKRMGALAAVNGVDSFYVDRFELYIFGAEICNGYRELVDSSDYHARLAGLQNERPEIFLDPQFDACLSRGIFPCVGNALGLDRLIAVLLGAKNIQDILPWPFASRFLPGTVALE
jgi:lysyl-tRNA synthetase class 2